MKWFLNLAKQEKKWGKKLCVEGRRYSSVCVYRYMHCRVESIGGNWNFAQIQGRQITHEPFDSTNESSTKRMPPAGSARNEKTYLSSSIWMASAVVSWMAMAIEIINNIEKGGVGERRLSVNGHQRQRIWLHRNLGIRNDAFWFCHEESSFRRQSPLQRQTPRRMPSLLSFPSINESMNQSNHILFQSSLTYGTIPSPCWVVHIPPEWLRLGPPRQPVGVDCDQRHEWPWCALDGKQRQRSWKENSTWLQEQERKFVYSWCWKKGLFAWRDGSGKYYLACVRVCVYWLQNIKYIKCNSMCVKIGSFGFLWDNLWVCPLGLSSHLSVVKPGTNCTDIQLDEQLPAETIRRRRLL